MRQVLCCVLLLLLLLMRQADAAEDADIPTLGIIGETDFRILNETLPSIFEGKYKLEYIPRVKTHNYTILKKDVADSLSVKKVDALFGFYNDHAGILSATLKIPYYVADSDIYRPKENNIFAMDIDKSLMISAYKDILEYNKRDRLSIITDDSITPNYFFKKFTNYKMRIAIISEDMSDMEVRTKLMEIKSVSTKYVYVVMVDHTKVTLYEKIFYNALYVDMMSSGAFWLIPELTTESPESFRLASLDKRCNCYGRFLDPGYLITVARTRAFIRAFAISNSSITNGVQLHDALMVDSIRHFLTAHYNTKLDAPILEKVRNTSVTGYTGVFEFDNKGRRAQFTLRLLGTTPDSHSELTLIGDWNPNRLQSGLPTSYQHLYGGKVLKDQRVQVGSVVEAPGFYLRKKYHGRYDKRFDGFDWAIIDQLTTSFDFHIDIKENADGVSGTLNETDGKWSGLMGALQRKEIDMTANSLTVTEERTKVSFAQPLRYSIADGYNMLIVSHKKGLYDFTKLLTPFSWFVWVAILTTGIILSFFIWIANKISPNDSNNSSMFSLFDSGFYVFGSFVMAKLTSNPRKPSARIFSFILWLGSIIFVSSYAATLVAVLMLPYREQPFYDLAGLYQQGYKEGWRWRFGRGTVTVSDFRVANNRLYRKMVTLAEKEWPDEMYVDAHVESIVEMLHNSPDGKLVYIGSGLKNDYMQYSADDDCQLLSVGEYDMKHNRAIFVKPDLPQISELNAKIVELEAKWVLLKERYYKSGRCSNAIIEQLHVPESLSFRDMVGAFVLLGIGLVLGLFTVVFEFSIIKLKMQLRRLRVQNLDFGNTYEGQIQKITDDGVIFVLRKRPARYFLANCNLHPDPKKIFNAEQLGLFEHSVIKVKYMGKDPIQKTKRFTREITTTV